MNVVLGGFLAVFGTAAVAVVLSQVARRFSLDGHALAIAVPVGALFAFVTGLAVVTGWAELDQATQNVHKEAGALVDLYWYASTLPDPAKTQAQSQLRVYVSDVQHQEWEQMAHRRVMSVPASTLLARLRKQFQAIEPAAGGATVRYAEALNRLSDLTGARRAREGALTEAVPAALWPALFVTGLLLLAAVILLGGPNPISRAILAGLAGGGIAFVIFLVQQIDHPFQGGIRVSDAPFTSAYQGFDEIDAIYKS